MIRKTGLALLIIMTTLFSNSALSTTEHALVPYMMSINYELKPNVPEILTNFVLWKINAKCVLSVENKTASISVMASNRPSMVNGKKLPLNEKVPMEVNDKETLLITADSGAKVELTNLDDALIVANCSLA